MLNQYQAVFKSLHSHEVKYLVIGGIAVILHGVPRATFDLDIIIEATLENAERLLKALQNAGMGTAELITPEELLQHEISIFQDFIRLDVHTFSPGITFSEAWKERLIMKMGGQEIYVLSKSNLIKAKRAAGRRIDVQDADALSQD